MKKLDRKSFPCFSLVKMLLLALVAVGVAASPIRAQNAVEGKFTLPFEARCGKMRLPAGQYKFSIQPLGTIQAVTSIDSGRHLVLVTVRQAGGEHLTALVMAMATHQDDHTNSNALVFLPSGNDMVVRSFRLAKMGLVVDINMSKVEGEIYARTAEPSQSISASKAAE